MVARHWAWIALLAALASTGVRANGLDQRNWGAEHSELTSGPQYAKSKAICRRLGDPNPPAADLPTPAEARALKSCSSGGLYYGEGMKPDYRKARLCAFVEAAGADDKVFGGSTILMQIYANGLGVPRNPDLATAYACQIEGAPAENDGRVLHMQALKTKSEHVDYCDDITSGLAEGYCQARASDKAAVGRDAKLQALQLKLSPPARSLYPPMKKAFDAFVDAHGDGEVDLSGTARAAQEIEEEDTVRDQFAKDLQRLLAGQWPPASAQDAKAADAQLNASYRKALAWAPSKDNFSTVKADDIRKAQRAWLTYRDAFRPFAASAAPNVSPDAVLTRLTKLRTAQLDDLAQ